MAEGFAAKYGVGVDRLYTVNTPRGEYVAVEQMVPGRKAAERLGEIIPRAIAEIPWPKTMYWTGAAGLRFIRPIRWVVALLGGQKVSLEVGGVAAETATSGHRFLGKSSIPVSAYKDYLRQAGEELCPGAAGKAPQEGGKGVERAGVGEGLPRERRRRTF